MASQPASGPNNNSSLLFNAELKLKKVLERYETEVIEAEQALDHELLGRIKEEAKSLVH